MNKTRIVLILLIASALASSFFWWQARSTRLAMQQVVEAGQKAKPPLWVVRDADTTIYLFGSVHMLPKGVEWLNGPIAKAVNSSDSLVMEIADSDAEVAGDSSIAKMATDTPVPPLAERVGTDNQAVLKQKIGGLSHPQYDRMESWAVALDMNRADMVAAGFDAKYGVESVIRPYFVDKRKPVTGLETVRYQMGLINDLPPAVQTKMLIEALNSEKAMRETVKPMLAAWAKGDVAALESTFFKSLEADPIVRERMITQRNRNWADWIDTRMHKPGTILVVVGTGHLIGPQSVQALLIPLGHKSDRLQ
jgi:uncharacterized protein